MTTLTNLLTAGGVTAIALKATVGLALALLLLLAGRRWPASLRHLLAAAVFGFLLFLPVAEAVFPARTIELPARMAESASKSASATPSVTPSAAAAAVQSEPVNSAVYSRPRLDLIAALGRIYFGGVAFFLGSLAIAFLSLVRMRNRAEVFVPGARLLGTSGIEVLISEEITVPMTFGFLRRTVLLPSSARDWSEEEIERALCHELEHVHRADWITQIASRIICAFYWPHPLVWMAWRRLCLEAERACDDAVIRGRENGERYAEQLVSLARSLTGRSVPALSMATRSNLGLRISAILDERVRRTPMTRRLLVMTAGGAILALVAIGPIRIAAAAAPLDEPTMESDEVEEPDEFADPVDEALLEAAERGSLNAIYRLLAAGANVNARIDGDGTPLLVAAREGHMSAVKLLMEKGADANLAVSGDGNPLIMAAREGHREIVEFLLDNGARIDEVVDGDENALIQASWQGRYDTVKLLIDRGANVNARVLVDWSDWERDHEWRTPLKMARRNGHEDVVRLLISAGAVE